MAFYVYLLIEGYWAAGTKYQDEREQLYLTVRFEVDPDAEA